MGLNEHDQVREFTYYTRSNKMKQKYRFRDENTNNVRMRCAKNLISTANFDQNRPRRGRTFLSSKIVSFWEKRKKHCWSSICVIKTRNESRRGKDGLSGCG